DRQGDIICTNCGMIQEARFISAEAEYRVFDEDDYDKIRVGKAHNPEEIENTLAEPTHDDVIYKIINLFLTLCQKGLDFIRSGVQMISESLSRIYKSADVPMCVEESAKSYFRLPCIQQLKEKQLTEDAMTRISKDPSLKKVDLKTVVDQVKMEKKE